MENQNNKKTTTWYCITGGFIGFEDAKSYYPTLEKAKSNFKTKLELDLSHFLRNSDQKQIMNRSIHEATAITDVDGRITWVLGDVVYTALEAVTDLQAEYSVANKVK